MACRRIKISHRVISCVVAVVYLHMLLVLGFVVQCLWAGPLLCAYLVSPVRRYNVPAAADAATIEGNNGSSIIISNSNSQDRISSNNNNLINEYPFLNNNNTNNNNVNEYPFLNELQQQPRPMSRDSKEEINVCVAYVVPAPWQIIASLVISTVYCLISIVLNIIAAVVSSQSNSSAAAATAGGTMMRRAATPGTLSAAALGSLAGVWPHNTAQMVLACTLSGVLSLGCGLVLFFIRPLKNWQPLCGDGSEAYACGYFYVRLHLLLLPAAACCAALLSPTLDMIPMAIFVVISLLLALLKEMFSTPHMWTAIAWWFSAVVCGYTSAILLMCLMAQTPLMQRALAHASPLVRANVSMFNYDQSWNTSAVLRFLEVLALLYMALFSRAVMSAVQY